MRLSFAEAGAALLLPLTLIAAFPMQEGASATGMAVAWLLFMTVGALPACLLEHALVRRTRTLPLQGLAQLTRDADARTAWRVLGPFSLIILMAVAALATAATADFLPQEPEWLGQSSPWLLLALAASMALVGAGRLLGAGGVMAASAMGVALVMAEPSWTLVLPGADGWRQAAMLALLSCGAGVGIQAWLALRRLSDGSAPFAALPFWGLQTLAGVLVLLAGDLRHQAAACVYVVPALFAVALMLEVLVQQLAARGLARAAALGLAVAGVAGLTALAILTPTFTTLVQLAGLLPLLVLSLFVGWVMKISHVRKALGLPSEGVYNLWRVAVRLGVPGLCVWVIAGMFL